MLSVRASRNIWAASAQSGLDKGEDDDPRRCALMRKWSYFGQVNKNAFHVDKNIILRDDCCISFQYKKYNSFFSFLFFACHLDELNEKKIGDQVPSFY